MRPPRRCACGYKVASGSRCPCQQRRQAEADARRPSARDRGYDSRWDAERAAYLKAYPKCARCPATATVVDHIIPHKGDRNLFWSRSNWQPLCRTCHDRWKRSLERRAAP
ncbi:HNH endonuclease signature motif containing protein [Xanthobacter flavus]|uniref:HNH endonuclease signature motif containing protein n=1 Tax=Xanthobacter flavus TaxID=281 RepID=UPI00372BA7FE